MNERGELLTPGNVSDANKAVVSGLAKGLRSRLFADKEYMSQELSKALWQQGLRLVTNVRKNMRNKLLPLMDKLLLWRRFIIETINDHLKNNEQIEHSRHRSLTNFSTNVLGGLIAYQLQPKKPSLRLGRELRLGASVG